MIQIYAWLDMILAFFNSDHVNSNTICVVLLLNPVFRMSLQKYGSLLFLICIILQLQNRQANT